MSSASLAGTPHYVAPERIRGAPPSPATDIYGVGILFYEILTGKVHPWNFKTFTGSYVDVSPRLASALTRNPHLKVFVACGLHDLATQYFGIRHSIDHLEVDPVLLGNVEFAYYEGGHMMYTIDASNDALNADLREFVEEAQNTL